MFEEAVGWEAETETDSDDDSEEDQDEDAASALGLPPLTSAAFGTGRFNKPSNFMDAYSSILEEQLQGTRMAESFVDGPPKQQPQTTGSGGAQSSSSQGMNRAPASQEFDASGRSDGLQPVDLDMNLVKSLLKSVAAQQVSTGI